ncbi:acyltransferase family protein [Gracilibacillus salitolerans]|uniref:Acyltransferase family protein n=1 Tax=Gracilibacillus salitolerans TaxID=2663022 RepID=A0A5Q2TNU7_9BACI|nr:acyltransferase family protein [Gracilibacillus salitolerans]QGH36405.1 acyltransferase family protein [Gracilibacillus salitolerans]
MRREAYFDNAKLLFIFLVVFGHLIQPLKPNIQLVDVIYQWIYIFHMPVFILVSGFFAKGASDKGYLLKLAKRILLPYFLFQLFYSIYFLGIGKNSWDTTLYDPHWGLWFLLSLFSWHILLIGYKKLKPVYGIPLAFAIGVLVGYLPFIGPSFSLSRTLVFFPFFLIGYWLSKERLFSWQTVNKKAVAIGILIAVFVVSYVTPTIPAQWLFGSHSYQGLDAAVSGGLMRSMLYIVAMLMVFSVLLLIPNKHYSFTPLGKNTMYVYLLHGVIIQYGRQANLLAVDQNFDTLGLAVIAAAIVWFLASKWVVTFTQPIVEGKTDHIMKWWKEKKNKQQSPDKVYQYQEKSS